MNTMFNEITVLTERTGVELAGHAVYGDIMNKRELIAQSAQLIASIFSILYSEICQKN